MSKETLIKFSQFFLIVILGVAADQWTKWYAEERLATQRLGHEVVLTVPQSVEEGTTVRDHLATEFTWNSPEELDSLSARWVRDDDGKRMRPDTIVSPEQKLHVTNRDVVIIEDYWDFQYTRNPGAAFGFLADTDSPYRKPFFIIISIIAIGLITYIIRGIAIQQQLMIWGLSLIAGGAIGNFIDRLRFSYVIDFILWKYTDAHRWPTFNVADALICAGVGLMFIEIVRDMQRERAARHEAQDTLVELEDDAPGEDDGHDRQVELS